MNHYAKTQISIKLDTDLLDRINTLASDVGVTCTAVIEQAVKQRLLIHGIAD